MATINALACGAGDSELSARAEAGLCFPRGVPFVKSPCQDRSGRDMACCRLHRDVRRCVRPNAE